jgi:outer membrane protein OmpA-like peptidoglycan-associated protein
LPAVGAARACENALADVLAQTKIEFAIASATIESRSAPVLDALVRAAAGCPGNIVVEGHTDSIGAPQANRALSVARADAVRTALIERGLAPTRLRAEGFGDERPLAGNDDAAGRARNRRIEFRAVTGTR